MTYSSNILQLLAYSERMAGPTQHIASIIKN